MTHTRIKICGITSAEHAQIAADCGADAIGLVFYAKSPRCVSAQQAAEIVAALPPFISVVGLFVDELPAEIERILSAVSIDVLQFHGDESVEFCKQFARPWIKALRVKPDTDIDALCRKYGSSRGMLLDAWLEGVPGGTGNTFDWQLAAGSLPAPIVLAGGLNESNIAAAIATVRPAAVDVSGGVESAPGIKDANKIKRFIAAVRAAEQHVDG